MNLKKLKFISIFIIFLLCFPLHFLYDKFPNSLTAIISPVNESIWEHMKLVLISYVLYGLIEYFILIKLNIKSNNFLLQLFIVPLIGIISYLIIYLPIYNIFKENMFINLFLLFLIIILEIYISTVILKFKKLKYQSIIGIIGLITLITGFGYFTYRPIKNYVFLDIKYNKYGINTYIK